MHALATRFKTLSGYAKTHIPLTDGEIRAAAPSIFAAAAHESRSNRYAYIPTSTLLARFRLEGFDPFMCCQARTRVEGKREHTKHMMRLRHQSRINGAEASEIILINSHDGSSSYQMLAGVYRFVCENGLVCGDTLEDFRVRHTGDVVDNVIEGAYRILNEFDKVDAAKDAMKSVRLNPGEQNAFALAALELRFDKEDGEAMPVTPAQILVPLRREDQADTLWNTFNVSQEHLIRGGIPTRTANNRRTRTRAVQGIDQSVQLNRALWRLSEEMAKLKAA
jgi:hypothetical protein